MTFDSSKNVLNDGFTSNALIDIEQDLSLSRIENAKLLHLIDEVELNVRAPIANQLEKITSRIKNKYHLSNKIINDFYFSDLLTEQIEKKVNLDQRLKDTIPLLKIPILKLLINDERFIKSSKHYFREFLDEMFELGIGWSQLLEEKGNRFLNLWNNLIKSTTHLDSNQLFLDKEIKQDFSKLKEFHQKALITERESCDEAKQKIRANEPIRYVDELLDNELNEKCFPKGIPEFFYNQWRKTLIIGKQDRHPGHVSWVQLKQFTLNMIEHFAIEENRSKIATVPSIRPNLKKLLIADDIELKNVLYLVDEINGNILNNIPMEANRAKPILEENRLKHLKTNNKLIKLVANLKTGQWLKIESKGTNIDRVKVALKYEPNRELLLVNHLGQHIKSRGYLGLAYDLVTKKMTRIDSHQLFNKCFVNTLEAYFIEYQKKCKLDNENLKKQKEEKLRQEALNKAQKEADALRKQNEEMESMLIQETHKLRIKNLEMRNNLKKQQTENSLLASEKTLLLDTKADIESKQRQIQENYSLQLDSIEKEKARLEQEHTNQISTLLKEKEALEDALQRKSYESIKEKTIRDVEGLTIGSWLKFTDGDTHVLCKVAVIYSSTGKYVFVNEAGIRVKELPKDEVVENLLNGSAEITKQESSFDRSMEQIIHTLKTENFP